MSEANMNNRFDFCTNGKVVYKGTQFTEYEDIEDTEEVVNHYGDLWGAICAAVAQIVDMPPFMRTLVQTTQYVGIELINAALSALPIAMTPGGPMGMAGRQALVLTGANSNARGALLLAGVPRVQVINPNIIFAERRGSGSGTSGTDGRGLKENNNGGSSGKKRVYKPSLKHDPKCGWGSPNPLPNDKVGQKLLDSAYSSNKNKQLYNYYEGKIVKFQPDDVAGGWHPYKVENSAKEVPTDVLRKMLDDGVITKVEYRKFRKNL